MFFPGWTDVFPLLPKPCCVYERWAPCSWCCYRHQEAVGKHWNPTFFWKTRPTHGKKPQNMELILVQMIILLVCISVIYISCNWGKEITRYKNRTTVALNPHLDQVLWYCHIANDKKIIQDGCQSTSSMQRDISQFSLVRPFLHFNTFQ